MIVLFLDEQLLSPSEVGNLLDVTIELPFLQNLFSALKNIQQS